MPNLRYAGILKVYDPIKGYGFISRQNGKDVFVYFDEFESGDISVGVGSQLEFEVIDKPGGKGPRAVKVKIIG